MKNTKPLVAALLCAVFAMPVASAEQGLYAGAAAGVGKDQYNCDDLNDFDEGWSCDDSAGAFRAHVGAQFSDNFAVEAGYTFLGKHEFKFTDDSDNTTTLETKYRAADLSALGILPLNEQFSARARVGLAFWDANAKEDGSGDGFDDTGTDLLYGLGGVFAVNEKLSLHADWIRITDSGNNFDLLLAGASYRF